MARGTFQGFIQDFIGITWDSFRTDTGFLLDSYQILSGFFQDSFRILSGFFQDFFSAFAKMICDSISILRDYFRLLGIDERFCFGFPMDSARDSFFGWPETRRKRKRKEEWVEWDVTRHVPCRRNLGFSIWNTIRTVLVSLPWVRLLAFQLHLFGIIPTLSIDGAVWGSGDTP